MEAHPLAVVLDRGNADGDRKMAFPATGPTNNSDVVSLLGEGRFGQLHQELAINLSKNASTRNPRGPLMADATRRALADTALAAHRATWPVAPSGVDRRMPPS